MQIRSVFPLLALVTLVACEQTPAKAPAPAATKESKDSAAATKTDDKAKPAASASAKPDVSCKGKPDIGKSASTFSLASVNGGKMEVAKGKVVLVDFWATWCEPCKKSFPKYQELYSRFKDSGFEILAVSVDDEKKDIPDFIRTHGAKFPVGWDDGHKIAECYQPGTMPSAYLIDKNGVVKRVHNGFKDGEEKALEKEIKELL